MPDTIIITPSPAVEVTVTPAAVIANTPGTVTVSPVTSSNTLVVSPIINTGTPTGPIIGIDQSLLAIAQSQVAGLVSALTGKANLAGGNAFTEAQTILGTVASNKVLEVKGASGQSASFFEVLANAGNTLFRVNATGYGMTPLGFIGGGTTMPTNARNAFYTAGASSIGVVVQGTASQSANLQEWQDSAGTILTRISPVGQVVSNLQSFFGSGATSISNARFNVATGSASVIGAVIRGAASQTEDLQQWQNSAGTVLSRIDSSGQIVVPGTAGALSSGTFIIGSRNSGGEITLVKETAATSNPGANLARLYFRDGTNAGTLKLVVRAGASGAETTILDNIPQT